MEQEPKFIPHGEETKELEDAPIYKLFKYQSNLERQKGYEDIPRYEWKVTPKFEKKIFIEKKFQFESGNQLIVSATEFEPGYYTYDILIVPENEKYDKNIYWKWDDVNNPNLIKGDGTLGPLIKAFQYLKDEVIPTLKECGAKELWIVPSDEKRSKAYAYVERLGFKPMIEIQRDNKGDVTYEGSPEYVLKF